MSRHLVCTVVSVADVVAVVNDGLRAVYEITRTLPLIGFTCRIIRVVPLGEGTFVQRCQCGVRRIIYFMWYAVYVLRIDEAATDTRRDVDEVEFHDTGDGPPILLMQIGATALFCGNFQIHTRCQSHLIVAVTVVTLTFLDKSGFPVVEACLTI